MTVIAAMMVIVVLPSKHQRSILTLVPLYKHELATKTCEPLCDAMIAHEGTRYSLSTSAGTCKLSGLRTQISSVRITANLGIAHLVLESRKIRIAGHRSSSKAIPSEVLQTSGNISTLLFPPLNCLPKCRRLLRYR